LDVLFSEPDGPFGVAQPETPPFGVPGRWYPFHSPPFHSPKRETETMATFHLPVFAGMAALVAGAAAPALAENRRRAAS
jgi:hypothetical protein